MTDRNVFEVKLVNEDDTTATFEGYGVVFDTVDMVGDTFTRDTDFVPDLAPTKLVYIDHSLPTEFVGKNNQRVVIEGIDEDVGRVVKVSPDDTGLYMQMQIEKASQYWDIVQGMYKTGKLGLSTGAVGHLVKRDGNVIKRWPYVEVSFTMTPAEHKTVGIDRIKLMADIYPDLKALIPEAAKDTAENDVTVQESDSNDIREVKEMSDKEKEVKDPVPDNGLADALKDIGSALSGINERLVKLEDKPDPVPQPEPVKYVPYVTDEGDIKNVNTNLKTGLGDSETKAFSYWVKSGDEGAIKASNATDMNIGTDADGGYAVPTGHHNEIIARRDDSALPIRLGVRRIPGVGTTVNVPVDNEADGEFVSTAEAAAFDLDAPALDQKAMTLVKYSKEVRLSLELLQDEDSRLMAFLADFIGRGFAKTLNNLLITEVGTNGTSLKTFAATGAIAAGEPQDIVGNNDLSNYLDDAGSVGWVTRSSTAWDIYSLSGNPFQYANTPAGSEVLPNLLGYPVYYSTEATAPAASAKSIYFGNWNYVGWRESPGLTVLRDPYSNAGTGQVSLWYYTRQVFTTLIAEAIGWGVHPSA